MGVDLSLILPNDCHNIKDNALAMKVFNDTIRRIIDYFGGREDFVSSIVIHNSDSSEWSKYCDPSDPEEQDEEEYSFFLPLFSANCYMRQGYWDIWVNAYYKDYFWPSGLDCNGNISLWPRKDAFDIAKVFGFSEGWVCDEFHSWNSHLDASPQASFEAWRKYGESEEDSRIYEFSLDIFKDSTNRLLNYHSKYHDSFAECHALVTTLETKHPNYKLLSLGKPTNRFVLVAKGKNLYILNLETGKSLIPFAIDCCDAMFNGAGFTVSRGNKKAFFNREGIQLTEFRSGEFSWAWHHGSSDIIITDEATGRCFFGDGKEASQQ